MNLILKNIITNFSIYSSNGIYQKDVFTLSGPNIISYNNVLTFAKMAYNAYLQNDDKNWYNIGFDNTYDLSGDNSSIRGYLFSNADSTVNVIAFKGTTLYLSTNDIYKDDKFNDNLYYSCCYYKQSNLFKDDCKYENYKNYKNDTCKKSCYQNSTNYQNHYITIAQKIVRNLFETEIIPKNSLNIFIGHSLGGTLATVLGLVYNTFAVTFESPGEKHYFTHTDINYNKDAVNKIYHFGHNADIIFTGNCQGALSWCYLAGYVIQTKCHIGNVCEYDAIGKLGVKESILTHRLLFVIDSVITKWNDTLPDCEIKTDCLDCESWSFA